jgi:hypothetical protein
MRRIILSLVVPLSATVLMADTPSPLQIKPGLWQVTMTSKIAMLPRPVTSTYKSCIKKEDLGKYPFADPEEDCTWNVASSTASKMEASGTCTTKGMGKIDFTMRLEALDPENVKGTGQLTANGPAGAINGSYAGTAKWIGATCPTGMK